MFARYVGQLRGAPCYVVKPEWRALFRARACAVGRRVLFRTQEDFEDPEVQAHEGEHLRQRELVGSLFTLVYLGCDFIFGYEANPFEVRAREAAHLATNGER